MTKPEMLLLTATEARRRWGWLLQQVEQGQAFTITLRGRPVARIEPIAA
jgi:prevent-host-death family protein